MSGSGLIYAAIAIMWAAVLIPMWLRNHETASENRSAERFGQAMRVLSRKGDSAMPVEESAGDRRADLEAPRAEAPVESPTRQATAAPVARRSVASSRPTSADKDRRANAKRARTARPPLTLAQRRARSLGVLVGLTFVTVLLAIGTPLPVWSALPFVVLLGAFVVHLRIQARQKLQRRRPAPARSSVDQTPPSERPASLRPERPQVDRLTYEEAQSSSSSTGVVQGPSRAVVVERKGEAAAAASVPTGEPTQPDAASEDDDAWRPNPLPLPTYVTAPKAVRPIKVIDLTTPGAWSSGRLFDDEVAEEDLLAAQVAEDELDALLDQEVASPPADADDESRRAVGD